MILRILGFKKHYKILTSAKTYFRYDSRIKKDKTKTPVQKSLALKALCARINFLLKSQYQK